MNERLEATVSGRVHMVMFRDFVCRKAEKLVLVGEVQNMKNGTVSVLAEGPREKLEELVLYLKKGPLLSKVEAVDASFTKAQGNFSSFTLRYE